MTSFLVLIKRFYIMGLLPLFGSNYFYPVTDCDLSRNVDGLVDLNNFILIPSYISSCLII